MTRLTSLAEEGLVNEIASLRREINEFKATGQALGSTSVALQRITTANSVDFSVSVAYHVIHGWEITYTPNATTLPNTDLLWQMFFNMSNFVGTSNYNSDTEYISVVNNVWTYRYWITGISPGLTATFDMKLVVYAMSQGTISVSQIQ